MSNVFRLLRACREKLDQEAASIRNGRSEGVKVVAYTCMAFPEAVAAGLGLRPLRLVCGISSEAASAGERLVRADLCPQVKCLLGNVWLGQGLHAQADLWAGLYTCDQKRRALQFLSSSLGLEVHPVQLPATRTDGAAGYYASHIWRFVMEVETAHNISFDPVQARGWQTERAKAAETLKKIVLSGSFSPLELHAMFHLYLVARPHGLADFFKEVTAPGPTFETQTRVVLTGSPISFEDTALLETLEAHGIGVIPLNCTGLNSAEGMEGVEGKDAREIVEALARQSFNQPPCARARPNTAIYERISAVLASTGAVGVIMKSLKLCDHWYTERKRMEKGFDVPVLTIDSDYAEGTKERTAARVEAFIEAVLNLKCRI